MKPISRILMGAIFGAAASFATAALAEFPDRPVELVVPAAPGAGSDLLVRAIATRLEAKWGKPVVVINKPGGNQMLAEAYVANAPADGYKILFVGPQRTILAAAPDPNAGYDVVNGLAPVSQLVRQPMVLVVNNNLAVKSVPDLVKLAKASPEKINYGNNGPGGPLDLSMKWFMSATGTKFFEIPYKSAGDMMVALMSGEINVAIASLSFLAPQLRSGKVTALAIADDTRTPHFPNVPTISEALGTGPFIIRHWQGAFVPAKTPKDIIAKINDDMVAAIKIPEVQEMLTRDGFGITGTKPDDFAVALKAETAIWSSAMAIGAPSAPAK